MRAHQAGHGATDGRLVNVDHDRGGVGGETVYEHHTGRSGGGAVGLHLGVMREGGGELLRRHFSFLV